MQSFENRTGGLLRYLGDVQQGVTWANGEVPTWNSTTQKFEPASAGGGNIYTTSDTLTGPRVVTFGGNTLTFNGSTNVGDKFIYNGRNNSESLAIQNAGSDRFVFYTASSALSSELRLINSTLAVKSGAFDKFTADSNELNFFDSSLATCHKIRFTGSTTGKNIELIRQGFANGSFIVGNSSTVTTEDISLQGRTLIKGLGSTNATTLFTAQNSLNNIALNILDDLTVLMPNLPTASTGLPTGAIWNNAGVLNIV